jgi:hypothetical protein
MSTFNYVKPEKFSIQLHPELSENWVQNLIAEDPSILGLGELVLRDKERIHPRAGRLDLLLQDPDTNRRYEVEIQLGATDESHIIKTIEYWDLERKRYPQYEHCAVIVAEDITSRFLNVISLFNGTIPLVAIQMQAFKVGENTSVLFTTVIDELTRGLVDEDEAADAAPTDRAYWENRGSKATVSLAENILSIAKICDPALELKFNKFYIGLSKNGQPNNFIICRPRKSVINLEIKIARDDAIDNAIEMAGLESLSYATRWGAYRLSLKAEDLLNHRDLISRLVSAAHVSRGS